MRDVIALENVEPKKRKVLYGNLDLRGEVLENRLKVEILPISKIF